MSEVYAQPVVIPKDTSGPEHHLGVLEDESQVGVDTANVVIECDLRNPAQAIEALRSPAAQDLALKYAQEKGIVGPRINDVALRPYPVDAYGKPILGLTGNVDRYRVDVPIIGQV